MINATIEKSLFPFIDTEQVTKAINTGLAKARDLIVSFSQKLNPTTDIEELENTNVSFSINWRVVQLGLVAVAGLTAHEQYQAWYNYRFHGQKALSLTMKTSRMMQTPDQMLTVPILRHPTLLPISCAALPILARPPSSVKIGLYIMSLKWMSALGTYYTIDGPVSSKLMRMCPSWHVLQ